MEKKLKTKKIRSQLCAYWKEHYCAGKSQRYQSLQQHLVRYWYLYKCSIYALSHNSESTFCLFSTEKCLSLQEYFLRIPIVYLQFSLQNSKKNRKVKSAFKAIKRATCTCTTVRTVRYHNLSLSPYQSVERVWPQRVNRMSSRTQGPGLHLGLFCQPAAHFNKPVTLRKSEFESGWLVVWRQKSCADVYTQRGTCTL